MPMERMTGDYISRDELVDTLDECIEKCEEALPLTPAQVHEMKGEVNATKAIRVFVKRFPAADVRPVPEGGIGEMSDGYHTFNGLYYQRMILFAALVRQNRDRAWKSYRHEDGELCFGGGWFIVGIDTPEGSYTYHYESKDFNLFDCEELPVGKHWDGHTEADVTRLLSLPAADAVEVKHGRWIYNNMGGWHCSECNNQAPFWCMASTQNLSDYCPNCGAKMDGGTDDGKAD